MQKKCPFDLSRERDSASLRLRHLDALPGGPCNRLQPTTYGRRPVSVYDVQ